MDSVMKMLEMYRNEGKKKRGECWGREKREEERLQQGSRLSTIVSCENMPAT